MKTFGYLAVALGALMFGVGSHADDSVGSATNAAQHKQGMASALNGLFRLGRTPFFSFLSERGRGGKQADDKAQ